MCAPHERPQPFGLAVAAIDRGPALGRDIDYARARPRHRPRGVMRRSPYACHPFCRDHQRVETLVLAEGPAGRH
jgi:hypothetical protein